MNGREYAHLPSTISYKGARLSGIVACVALLLALALTPTSASARLVRALEPFSPIDGSGAGAAFTGTPRDVAVENSTGNLFVVASNGQEVRILGGEGGIPSGVASPYGITGLNGIVAIEVDNSATSPGKGTLYVANQTVVKKFIRNSSTEKYEEAGTLIGSPALNVEDVVVDTKGNVLVSNAQEQVIVKFSPSGAQVARYRTFGPDSGGFQTGFRPEEIAIDAAGNLFSKQRDYSPEFLDNSIWKLSADSSGELSTDSRFKVVIPAKTKTFYYGPIAMDQEANSLFVTNNIEREIEQYDSTTLVEQARFGEDILTTPGRLAINSSTDRVYVIEAAGIHVFGPAFATPDATVGEVSTSGPSAVLRGVVNPQNIPVTECIFEYGPTTAYGSTAPCVGSIPTDSDPHDVTAEISGLALQKQAYHFRLVVKYAGGKSRSSDKAFTSGEVFTTTATSAVGATTATVNGSLRPEGSQITECDFEYGETESYGFSKPCAPAAGSIPADSGVHVVSANLIGLLPNRRYHARIVATGGLGSFEGADVTFRTLGPPIVAEEDATEIQNVTATLRAQLEPRGFATSYHFEYGTNSSYGNRIPVDADLLAGSGTSPEEVTVGLSGLVGNTTYHFRLVATNAQGTTNGPDQSFSTVDADCANEKIRERQVSTALPDGTSFLPDCMGLEMVTPPRKFNQDAYKPGFSLDGERIKFQSDGGLVGATKLGGLLEHYVASRGPGGWVSAPATTPPEYVKGSGVVAKPCAYASDLSRWNLWGSTALQSTLGITTAFEGRLGGAFSPLSPILLPINANFNPNTVKEGGDCVGGSINASHEFFSFGDGFGYIQGQPGEKGSPEPSTYDAYRDGNGQPTIRLLARDKFGTVFGGNCGAILGGKVSGFAKPSRGAISADTDASRVFFSARHDEPEGVLCNAAHGLRIMKRTLVTGEPVISEISHSECTRAAPACNVSDGDDLYRGASQEGDRVFFMTTRQLTNSDLDTSADLYLFDGTRPEGSRLTQVSAGDAADPTQGEGANVLGVSEFAGDGSHVYFVATGLLTTAPNQAGNQAIQGGRNLYMYERDDEHPGGRTVFIGVLEAADSATWANGPGTNSAAAVPLLSGDLDESRGGDGHVLVFLTEAPLLPGDLDGGARDVYRFDADSGLLQLISNAEPGGTDDGTFDVARIEEDTTRVLPNLLSFDRWASNDGGTITFTTKEALSSSDTDGAESVYVWHEGSLTAIPIPSIMPTVSLSGDGVAFVTETALLPEDGDGAKDVYVARAGGGFPIPPPPNPCLGEACQGSPSARPAAPRAASNSLAGRGNVRNQTKARHKNKKKRRGHKRHHSMQKQQGHRQGGRK